MESNVSKALVIGTGLLVSIGIVTASLTVINTYTKSYQLIEDQKIGIVGGFGELEKYNNTELVGMDALNAAKKYWRDRFVSVVYQPSSGAQFEFHSGLSEDVYESNVIALENYLNRETPAPDSMSYYNKKCRAIIEFLEDPYMGLPETGKIDSKVRIKFTEV